jgi:cobalt-zinc-cadmium efflux system protein
MIFTGGVMMVESAQHKKEKYIKQKTPGKRTTVARLVLGAVFIFAGIDKIRHPGAFSEVIYNYQVLPDQLINGTAILLPWLELILGGCLVAGLWLPGAIVLTNMLLLTFFGALLFNVARGLNINCGCFSTSTEPVGGTTMAWYVLRDSFFLLLGGRLFFALRRMHSDDERQKVFQGP